MRKKEEKDSTLPKTPEEGFSLLVPRRKISFKVPGHDGDTNHRVCGYEQPFWSNKKKKSKTDETQYTNPAC
jgi:hypothetical protein